MSDDFLEEDFAFDEPEDDHECWDHEEMDDGVNLVLRCGVCGKRRDMSIEEHTHMIEMYEEYHREPTWLERLRDAWGSLAWRIRNLIPRRRMAVDDDVPF